jgi:hypothetical protein
MAGRFDIALKKPVPVGSVPVIKKGKNELKTAIRRRVNLGGLELEIQRFKPKDGDMFFICAEMANRVDISRLSDALAEIKGHSKINFSTICTNYGLKVTKHRVNDVCSLRLAANFQYDEFSSLEDLKNVIAENIRGLQDTAAKEKK